MDPETLYVIYASVEAEEPEVYGRTPDGIGMYWYDADQYDEACSDVCEVERVRTFWSHREFDEYRWALEA